MPPASRRTEQCCIVEQGRRCRRNGTGAPALCGAHRAALGSTPEASPIAEMIDAVLAGRPPPRRAMEDFWVAMAEKLTGRTLTPAEIEAVRGGGFTGGAGPGGWSASRSSSSGSAAPDPDRAARAQKEQAAAERARAVGRARRTLGFTAKEPLTRDQVKGRYRELARKHHPDRGGSVARMQEINGAMEILLESP